MKWSKIQNITDVITLVKITSIPISHSQIPYQISFLGRYNIQIEAFHTTCEPKRLFFCGKGVPLLTFYWKVHTRMDRTGDPHSHLVLVEVGFLLLAFVCKRRKKRQKDLGSNQPIQHPILLFLVLHRINFTSKIVSLG